MRLSSGIFVPPPLSCFRYLSQFFLRECLERRPRRARVVETVVDETDGFHEIQILVVRHSEGFRRRALQVMFEKVGRRRVPEYLGRNLCRSHIVSAVPLLHEGRHGRSPMPRHRGVYSEHVAEEIRSQRSTVCWDIA